MGLLTRGDEDNDDLEVFPQIQPVRQEAGYLYRTTDSVFLNFPDCPELPKSKRSIPTGIVTYTSTTSKGPFFASWSPTTRSANPWRYIQSTLMGASPATEFVAPGKEAEERLKQCILSLTRNSALALGLDHTGLIQEGFNADLLFLKVHQVESDILSDSVFGMSSLVRLYVSQS